MRHLIPILLIATSASAQIGPDFMKPTTDVPVKYKGAAVWRESRPLDNAPKGAWWKVFKDERCEVFESYNRRVFAQATGVDVDFVQYNYSRSLKNVIRGLHYQVVRPQGKLISTLRGEIFDVAVDLRRSSATFGRWRPPEC